MTHVRCTGFSWNPMNRRLQTAFALLAMLFATSISAAQDSDVYFANSIWTGEGEPIADAAMLVVDGRIVAIGPRSTIEIPAVANRHDLGAGTIIPGMVAAQTSLSGGTSEPRTLTPGIRAIDGFDFFADRETLIKSGITTVQVSPSSARLMPGIGGVTQLEGEEITDRILSEEESLRIVLSESSRNPPRIYEPEVGPVSEDRPLLATRPQFSKLSTALAGLRQIFRQATEGMKNDGAILPDDQDEIIETVAGVLSRKVPVRITAQTAAEIRGAMELAKEFDLKVVLDDCRGLEPFRSQFKEWKKYIVGVILAGETPGQITNPNPDDVASRTRPWEFARELLDAGIPVAIRTRTDADLTQFAYVAGQFMKDDLNVSELLAAVTSAPAKLMNVADEVGTLATGKRADFVVLEGQPFGLHSRIQSTYVAGVACFERKRDATTTTVVQAGRVYLGEGQFKENASVVVKGKTVRGIGSGVSAPLDANVKTFEDAVIVPGFVDMGTSLGLGGQLRGNVTLQTKLSEQLYVDDPAIEFARSHGITTALLATAAGQASPVVAFKLGDDARVISDPVAIRFRLNGDPAAGTTTNERLLKSGKAYADSWTKYEKNLAEYKIKLKEWEATQKKTTTKTASKKDGDKKDADKKSVKKKSESDKKKDADKDKEKEKKKDAEKDKEKDKEKEKDKKEKKKKLPDPVTGTWEGELESERPLPPQIRSFEFELKLEGESITGTVKIFRQEIEITEGSFDRDSREVKIKISRRGTDIEITGSIDADGKFSGSLPLGRLGEVQMTAERTVDKSEKDDPEEDKPEKDEKKEKKKEKPEEEKDKPEEKKDKPEEKKDKEEEDKKEKPADDKKKTDAKKDDKADSDGKKADDKKSDADKAAEKKKAEKPKEPKKPSERAALEPYRALFAGDIPAIVESRDLFSMKATVELFSKKYKLRTIILGANDLSREPNILDDTSVSVCVGPQFSVTVDDESVNLPQLVATEQLMFGFQSSGTTGSGLLPSAIQFSVSKGLSTTDALDGLAMNPAKMLSEKSSFGQLAAGKDADLVVLSGSPFEHSTKVLAVMIDGVWVYEREEEK